MLPYCNNDVCVHTWDHRGTFLTSVGGFFPHACTPITLELTCTCTLISSTTFVLCALELLPLQVVFIPTNLPPTIGIRVGKSF